MGYLISVCWLLLVQTQTTTSSEAAQKAAEVAKEAPRGFFQDFQYMLPVMAAIMALYFILLRPQQDPKKATGAVSNLKKNDRVLTVGGILGTVISSREESEYTTIRIDENSNTKIQVRTASIARVLDDDESKTGSSSTKK